MQTNKLDRIGIILCQCLKGAAGNYFVITKSVWDKCMAVPLTAKSVWDSTLVAHVPRGSGAYDHYADRLYCSALVHILLIPTHGRQLQAILRMRASVSIPSAGVQTYPTHQDKRMK